LRVYRKSIVKVKGKNKKTPVRFVLCTEEVRRAKEDDS
jgi:hypothetical protein